jgi:4-amino-4-deoxy-L-arabinose transferase-like glycosyltransferase
MLRRVRGMARGRVTKDVVLLFVIAIGVRAAISLLQVTYGIRSFPFGFPLSSWGDFYAGYAQWLVFIQKGLIPYRDFYTYKYTPLFIYTLYPFFAAAGARAAAIPIVVSDAATAVLVYLIAKRFAGNRVGFAAGLLYAFAPFVLYYEDYLWLSSQPMTFFMILAVYLLKEERPVLSFASLAVAAMFKQEAIFLLPAYLLLYFKGYRASMPKGIAVFLAIVLIVSLPFLILAPIDYIGSLNYFQLSLGPLEPAAPIASSIVNAVAPSPNPLGTCALQTIPGLYTGTLCGSVVNLKEFAASLVAGRIDQIATFLEPLLLLILAPALYVSRRAQNFAQMLCIYSLLLSLFLFQEYVEPSLAYYFVPVYALIFASVLNRLTLVLATATALLSLTISEGPFQIILPLGFLFALVAVQGTPGFPTDDASTL